MRRKRDEILAEKIFSKWIIILCAFGLLVNVCLAKLVVYLELPFYLDNVGSILVGALGGVLPGVLVGFISNVINSLTTPISLYYGIITVIIAFLAARFSEAGYFKTWQGRLKILPYYVFWGGIVGSMFTWGLFGGTISGIGAPYALFLHNNWNVPAFLAQLSVDILIDIPDKFMTIFLVALCLKNYPKFLYNRFPLSYLYDRSKSEVEIVRQEKHYRHKSLDKRLVQMVVSFISIVSIFSIAISTLYYHGRLMDSYAVQTENAVWTIADNIDGNKIEYYLENGKNSEEYLAVEKKIYNIQRHNKLFKYIYVYQPVPNGCKAVFDIDTPDMKGTKVGELIKNEQGFTGNVEELIARDTVVAKFNNGPYGYLMTGYAPIMDSKGTVVAYAGVDIGLETYVTDMLIYIIQIISLVFALTIIIAFIALWYVKKEVTSPLNSIVNLAKNLDEISPKEWLLSDVWQNKIKVTTGDEIETLYSTMCELEENIAHYVNRISSAEQQLVASKELARVNNQLNEAVEKLNEATKIKSDFYSRMSHDMRTPMNGIIGLVNLSKNEQNICVLHENIKKIGASSRYLLRLINDTLDVSRMESRRMTLEHTPIYLERFMDNIKTMLRPTLEAKHLKFEYEKINVSEGQVVLGDEMRLTQVFMNLLSNAIKFTPAQGLLRVTIEQVENKKESAVLRISFADTGYGMSPDFLAKRIFTPFSQERNPVTREYAGTGLGLAIVKNLVELMGGVISVKSQLGEGTTFILVLPFTKATEEDLSKAKVVNKNNDDVDLTILQGKTILLCEDHPLNTEIVVKLLGRKDVQVEIAENGLAGLEKFKECEPWHFAAILMDIRMPIMDGLDATRNIRNLKREDAARVPIIAMTANAFPEDIEASKEAGMNAHLAKPLDPKMMYKTLAKEIAKITVS